MSKKNKCNPMPKSGKRKIKAIKNLARQYFKEATSFAQNLRLDGYNPSSVQILTRKYPRLIDELIERIEEDENS